MIMNSINFKSLPFWSWNFFLGNNFWASKSYQLLGDLFAYIALLFDTHVYNRILIVTIMKYFISALGFYFYLRNRTESKHTRIIGALLYAFSSYLLRFTEQPFYVTFYALIPFYLISIEDVLKRKRPYFFIAMVTLMTITNYYLFYTLALFSVIYFVYRINEDKVEFKKSIYLFLQFLIYAVLGVGLTAFILVPTFYAIIDNPRVGNVSSSLLIYPHLSTYYNIVMSYLLPMQSSLNGMFVSSYYNLESYIWSGSLVALLLPQALVHNDLKVRRNNQILFILLGLLLIFPFGGYLMHGFSEPNLRWEFIILIFSIILVVPYIENPRQVNQRVLWITSLVYFLIFVIAFYTYQVNFGLTFADNYDQLAIYVIYIVIYITFIVVLKVSHLKSFALLLVVAVVFELTFTTHLAFNKTSSKNFDWNTIRSVESVLGRDRELTEYLQSLDDKESFYRVFVPYESIYWVFSLNMNLIYDFMDVKTYDTTYQTSNNDLFRIVENDYFYDWFIELRDPNLIDFTSVKYAVVTHQGELPHLNFDRVGNYGYFELYRNNNYRGFIKSYNQVISYDNYESLQDSSLINTTVIVDTENLDELESLIPRESSTFSIEHAQRYPNMLLTYADNQDDVFVVSSVPYDKGWTITLNGESLKTYSTNGGFVSFLLPSGGGELKFYFMPFGFKQGITLSMIFFGLNILNFVLIEYKRRKKSINPIEDGTPHVTSVGLEARSTENIE